MARTKLTKRARNTKQQEDSKVKLFVEKKCGWWNQQIDMKTSTVKILQSNSSFHNLKKQVKKGGRLVLEMFVRRRAVFASFKKRVYYNYQ